MERTIQAKGTTSSSRKQGSSSSEATGISLRHFPLLENIQIEPSQSWLATVSLLCPVADWTDVLGLLRRRMDSLKVCCKPLQLADQSTEGTTEVDLRKLLCLASKAGMD